MKQKIITAVIVFLFAIQASAQKTGYTISGEIKNLPDNVTFYLIQNKEGGGADTVDRVKSKNQKFIFKGNLEDEGVLRFVKLDTSVVKVANEKQSWVRIMLDNSGAVIQLTGEFRDWPAIKIEGSKLTEGYNHYLDASKTFLKTLTEEINGKIERAKDQNEIALLKKEYSERYLQNLNDISKGSYVIPLMLYTNGNLVQEVKEAAYQKLSAKQKSSYYAKRLGHEITGLKASKVIGIGKIIPDFPIITPEGKTVSVRAVALKSKYTLIDFWASWCKPCRQDIPNMKKVYDAFHSKGFNIVSVSTDSSLGSWQKALKEENTPWANGIQEGKQADDIFGLFSIPAYILLNEKAEIVQMDLNSKFFSRSGGAMNGEQVVVRDSKAKRLRGDDLYEVMKALLGEPGGNK